MAIALVQTAIGTATGTVVIPFSTNLTGGNLIVVSVGGNGSISTISDNLSNTYGTIFNGTFEANAAIGFAYAANVTGGAGTVTIKNTSNSGMVAIIREYSGLLTVSPLDKSAVGSSSTAVGTLFAGTTTTTSQGSELAVAMGIIIGGTANITYDAIYTNGTAGSNTTNNWMAVMEQKVLSTTGQQVGTFIQSRSTSNGWGAVIATFKAASIPQGTILYDNSASGSVSSGTTISWTHTVNSNQQSILIVNIAQSIATGTFTNIAYAGTNLTKVITAEGQDDTELWYLLSPPAGLGTITGTTNSTGAASAGFSVSYTGVNQTNPIQGSYSGTATGTLTLADTVLGVGNIVTGAFVGDGNTPTVNTGTSHGTQAFSASAIAQADLNAGTLIGANSIFTLSGVMVELNKGTTSGGTTVSYPGFMSLLGVGQI